MEGTHSCAIHVVVELDPIDDAVETRGAIIPKLILVSALRPTRFNVVIRPIPLATRCGACTGGRCGTGVPVPSVRWGFA